MLLTQSSTPVIGWISTLLGYVIDIIFRLLDLVGIQNIGLSIIIFTVFVRLIMTPLTIKQQKFTKINQAMQPEITKIQKKYRNKKDQASLAKQNEEIQAVYEKYGTSPTGGCAQLLIQFPIFLAFFNVVRNVPAYIPQVKDIYMTAVTAIQQTPGYVDTINKIADGVHSSYISELPNNATSNQIIDVLNYFTADAWGQLADAMPSISGVIESVHHQVAGINNFIFGINVAQAPGFRLSVYLLIPILAALFQFLTTKTMKQPDMGDNPAAGMTKSMTYVMPLMSFYFCLVAPAGMGLYWATSALFMCIQQIIVNKYMEHADLDKMIEKNREKAAKKKAKGKKTMMERLTGAADNADNQQQVSGRKTITDVATMNLKKMPGASGSSANGQNVDVDQLGEIGKNAYLVSQYDKEQNTRGGKK
ncbi:hypothetical protein B5E53_16755 [Eubacterium sp. An11]|uniref:YidC/Oxa1 family membrane protein insertase n=1 Tax=Eubacterium sp. An11 TaxID=1965542 RepID=UPI000B3AFF33|nr:YidC/Oxa1 family membrane protein insertase [Eubacterium sp. An11]OUQ62983.1 hypothetical protein B5E53_16755 [Eubacterium sp. An11]